MQNFRTYQLALTFYKRSQSHSLPRHLKDQFNRAAASIVLNLAEGSAKRSRLDRRRFYEISFASIKECKSILQMEPYPELSALLDCLAAHSFKLLKALSP